MSPTKEPSLKQSAIVNPLAQLPQISMPLTITFDLVATGVMSCTIRPARRNYTFSPSLDSDVLGDLVLTAISVLRDFRSLSFAYYGSQTECLFIIERDTMDCLKIEIAEVVLNLVENEFELKTLVEFSCKPTVFARAVHSAANELLFKHGTKNYNKMWPEHPFPKELLNVLRNALASVKNDA